MTAEEIVEQVRDLHKPAERMWLECDGCDSEGWESETPEWPCRTARLVYTTDEIALYGQQFRNHQQARREQRASELASPTQNLIPQLWAGKLEESLAAHTFLERLNKRVNE